MPQDATPTQDGDQTTTARNGGSPNSIEGDNGLATAINGAGAPQEPLTDEELQSAIEERLTELGNEPAPFGSPVTPEEIERLTLQHQWKVLTDYGHRGGLEDYINGQMTNGHSFSDYTLVEQRALIGQHWRGFHTEAGRLGPLGVVDETLEGLGVPWWARIVISRGRRPQRGTGTDRTNGNGNNRRQPCRNGR